MNEEQRDRQLGIDRRITRRDFLNGMAVGIGALGFSLPDMATGLKGRSRAVDHADETYPPALTGMRGSAPSSYDVAHALRDGTFWESAGTPIDSRESYDLIVVGAGISGLAAAHFYRQNADKNSRILILDNNDDFGTRPAQRVSRRATFAPEQWRN